MDNQMIRMTLLFSSTLFVSSCFLNPFRRSQEENVEDVAFEQNAEKQSEAFLFSDTSEIYFEIIQQIGEINDRIIRMESKIDALGSMSSVSSASQADFVLWPRDENIWFAVSYNKVDKIGRKARLNVRSQWRHVTNAKDSDWYDMRYRFGLDITDNDYMLVEAKNNGDPDTVTVRVAVMREIDPTEEAIWYFRTRVEAGRKYSEWDSVEYGIRLVDPITLQTVSRPRIELVK